MVFFKLPKLKRNKPQSDFFGRSPSAIELSFVFVFSILVTLSDSVCWYFSILHFQVMHLDAEKEMMSQCVALLGKFIAVREPNIRYLGLVSCRIATETLTISLPFFSDNGLQYLRNGAPQVCNSMILIGQLPSCRRT